MKKFPRGFLWGAATSAHQVEGQNFHNDWWAAEQVNALKERSGLACNHYELYEKDFEIAKSLNHNSHRFSLEWSRIEPQEGKFDQAQIEHYRKVILSLKAKELEPVVTLHHFTNPNWFSHKGGWEKKENIEYFLRFVEKVIDEYAQEVKFWITINEPLIYSSHSYLFGVWPPKKRSLIKTLKVTLNMAKAHIEAYHIIHKIYQKKHLGAPYVSIAANLQAFEACSHSLKNKLALYLRHKFYNIYFIENIFSKGTLDFIGINYYGRSLIDVSKWGIGNICLETCQENHLPLRKNSLGWDIYPEGLFKLLIDLSKFNLPILISENGICTEDDSLRWDYIREHLDQVYLAIDKGVRVFGYIYWSLIDNFEWDKGFEPRFGLVDINYANQERTIRESARKFARAAKNGDLDEV